MPTDVTTEHERTIIEQSKTSVAVLSSEQIVAIIEELHACYDYCAAWKEPAKQDDSADD